MVPPFFIRIYSQKESGKYPGKTQGPQGQGRGRGRELPQTAAFRKMTVAFSGKGLTGRIPACFPFCSYHRYHFEIK
jgi:hypothetical protein